MSKFCYWDILLFYIFCQPIRAFMLGIFIDIEATGLDPTRHRVLEIAIKIIDLSDGTLKESYESVVSQPQDVWKASDPESLAVNGFTWEMLGTGKAEDVVADEIIALFGKHEIRRQHAVFIGQNSSFDRAFFAQLVHVYDQEKKDWPYHWLDLASMYWGLRMRTFIKEGQAIPQRFSISKNDIAKHFGIGPEERPHRAMNGVDHLLECYQSLVKA